jgi:parallel beta-helix repeat protein
MYRVLLLVPVVAVGIGLAITFNHHSTSTAAMSANQAVVGETAAPASPQGICGTSILHSPWNYNGKAGTYTAKSAPKGLPTFGSAGTAFPYATKIVVVPAGNNTAAANKGDYEVNYGIVYFEPGVHQLKDGMYNGHNAVYIGGYSPSHGAAIIDGVSGPAAGGARLADSKASSGNKVYDTWEYLTIRNFTSSLGNAVMGNVNGGAIDIGDTYKFDTIGPNEYGYRGSGSKPRSGMNSGGGYAIDAGSDTTIEYNCLTHNAEGAFNADNVTNLTIAHNEISWNGIGEYPDMSGPGGSPFSCGCSGGGKVFYSLNASVTNNYVHNNYNDGIWFDFDNGGANISGNYVASNWGSGIAYEASYNANISDNTLVGNGWASDGAWPAGIGGKACYNGISCAAGLGAITGAGGGNAYGAIDLSNSGGNANIRVNAGAEKTRYSGQLLVDNNVLLNNFGGVKVYTDTNRYPGNIDYDSSCGFPLGVRDTRGSTTYYQQSRILTGTGATIRGSSVTTARGTMTICADYGGLADRGYASVVRKPIVGMAVFNLNTGKFLGNVTSASSAQAFTIGASPGNASGVSLLLSAYGGCGPADYYHGAIGVASGTPRADYWDNCLWASRNVTVKGNTFSINAADVTGCEVPRNLCGVNYDAATDPGIPQLMRFWTSYESYIAKSAGGLGNVWAQNTYEWPTDTSLGWRFWAGQQGVQVSRTKWQAAPYRQDAGSTFP